MLRMKTCTVAEECAHEAAALQSFKRNTRADVKVTQAHISIKNGEW